MIEGQETDVEQTNPLFVRGEKHELIIARILEHVPGWAQAVQEPEQVEISKLNGLSNACYKVSLKNDVDMAPNCPRTLLYRKFECMIVNKQVEAALFESMSEAGLGPKLIYGCAQYRIEGFFDGRPLTIWEMRNPVIMEEVVKAVHGMHTNHRATDAIQEIMPMQPNQLGIDVAIDQWGPAVIQRIGKIRTKLGPETALNTVIHKALKKLETTFLKPGYQEKLRNLVPREKIVLSHNDCQENNILSSLEDATRFILIDYEYGMWNPQSYDMACYLNEMVCDNAYPLGVGIAYYMRNFPSDGEIELMTKMYCNLESIRENSHQEWSMSNSECSDAVLNTKKCMILNNYYWAVWSIMMLTESDETDTQTYHWEIGSGRCDIYLKCVEQFGIGQI